MPFDPEHPRTEDREFHPNQEGLSRAVESLEQTLASLESGVMPQAGESEARFRRSIGDIETFVGKIKEKIG